MAAWPLEFRTRPRSSRTDPDGGFFLPVDGIQQGIGLLVAALQANGPAQLRGQFGFFVGVVGRVGKGVPETLFGQPGSSKFQGGQGSLGPACTFS